MAYPHQVILPICPAGLTVRVLQILDGVFQKLLLPAHQPATVAMPESIGVAQTPVRLSSSYHYLLSHFIIGFPLCNVIADPVIALFVVFVLFFQ